MFVCTSEGAARLLLIKMLFVGPVYNFIQLPVRELFFHFVYPEEANSWTGSHKVVNSAWMLDRKPENSELSNLLSFGKVR